MLTSSPDSARILLIESDPQETVRLRHFLEHQSHLEIQWVADAQSLDEGAQFLNQLEVDAVLLDANSLSEPNAETLIAVHRLSSEVPVIVLASPRTEEFGRQLVQMGAEASILKRIEDGEELSCALRAAFDRARHQAEFESERAFLGTLLENIPDRIYFKDEQSRFIRINRALTERFGLSRPEDAYGKTDADFFTPERARETLLDEQMVMITGQPILNKVESENLQDGSFGWCLTTKLPLRNRRGRIIGTCGISREITSLKQMEAALETERNLLRAVIDHLPDHIFLKDFEGRYVLDNVAHQRWLGARTQADVAGRTAFDFFPEETAMRFREADEPVLRTGEPLLNFEERSVDAAGQSRWALVTKVPWRADDGRILGLVCLKRNITEQKLAEAKLKQANLELAASREEVLSAMAELQTAHTQLREMQQQLIEAEKMKLIGRVTAGIAHEVKNPLAIVKMGLEFWQQQPAPNESCQLVLREMQDAVNRADNVILGLLDFSKPSRLETRRENLNAMIHRALASVRVEMRAPVEIVAQLDPHLPLLALDAEKMNQVLVNLFTNSIHAMSEGGTLGIRTYTEQLTGVGQNIAGQKSESFRIGQSIAVLEIEDTGHGIPEDKLSKIFEPFFTTKPTGKGTGLGLSVVKTIVDLHGATISIRNRMGGGAIATLMFRL